MFRRSLTAAALGAIALLLFAARPQTASDPAFAQIDKIVQTLSGITGLAEDHAVPYGRMTKRQLRQFLNKRIKKTVKPEEIRADELSLKMFGLVPQDFDLKKSTLDLLTEQAAAFYDYDRKKLFITESTPSESQEPVLAHELAHALADQNFNLGKFIKQGRKSDDGATARMAVMEGQATWIMSEFLAQKNGQSLKTSPGLVAMMSNLSETGAGQYPVFESAPLYERITLVFPYTKGMLFQNAVFQRDGQEGFAEVFRKPPISTQQILHPDKYFAGVKPSDPALPDLHLKGYRGLVGGSMGELEHSILLEQYASKERALQLAPHWRGSNFALLENKSAARVVLFYAVEWDGEAAARDYFAFYREALRKKWKSMTVATESEDAVTGTGDDGAFELRRKGAVVTSVEGLDPAIH
jgi:hypothetical protein